MARPSIETARDWATKPIRDRLPGGRRRTGLLDAPKAAMRRRRRTGLLDTSRAAMRSRRRRQRWLRARRRQVTGALGSRGTALRGRVPSMPRPFSVSMPSMPRPSRRRRRARRMAGNLGVLVGAGAGYVLGTRAGRERYQQIVEQARQLWQRPEVRDMAAKGRDRVGTGVERAAATAGERLQQARERAAAAPSTNGPTGQGTTTNGPTGQGTTTGGPTGGGTATGGSTKPAGSAGAA